jgi:hypothetical protein
MKTTLLFASALALMSQTVMADGGYTRLQNTQHVVGKDCTIYVNMNAEFPMGSELSAFGGAGSDARLSNLKTIAGLLHDRGYTVVADANNAEYRLELANGIQCVMTDGEPGAFVQWMMDNFDTLYTASGRFSGKAANGTYFENTSRHSFEGFHKVSKFRDLVGSIVSYCRKS